MATKYSVSVWDGKSWEGVALFSDKCDFDAMIMFCIHQFELGNSVTTPAENIAITDIDTGEVLWDWVSDSQDDFDEPADIDDDCGFDPYEGCFTYDC